MDAGVCSFFANLAYSNDNLEYINAILASNSKVNIIRF